MRGRGCVEVSSLDAWKRVGDDEGRWDAFDAEFTHQVFREDESVFGYAGLALDVRVQDIVASAVEDEIRKKISSAMNPADPVVEQMREWFDSDGLCELYEDEERFKREADMANHALVARWWQRVRAMGGDKNHCVRVGDE